MDNVSTLTGDNSLQLLRLSFDSKMPQNEHIELHRKRFGRRLDHEERKRKKEAREVHKRAEFARNAIGEELRLFGTLGRLE